MLEPVIISERLELHHISAEGIIELFEEKSDTKAIAGRDFTNPHKNLIENSGPLAWRVPQVKVDPSLNKWFVRFIVLKERREVIGSSSFHGAQSAPIICRLSLSSSTSVLTTKVNRWMRLMDQKISTR